MTVPIGALRLAVVVLGGLAVLQGSNELDAAKVMYFAVAASCIAAATVSIIRDRRSGQQGVIWPLLALSAALTAWTGLSVLAAGSHGVPFVTWLRDAVSYGLYASVPVLAWDAGTSGASPTTRFRFLVVATVLLGLLATASWAVEWFDRRGIVDLPIDRLLMPGGYLAIALYGTALAMVVMSHSAYVWWTGVAGLVLGTFLATGTRSALLLLILPGVAVVLGNERSALHRLRAVLVHLVVAAAIVIIVGLAAGPTSPGPPSSTPTAAAPQSGPGERIGSVGNLLDDATGDPSVRERIAQYRAAWQLFTKYPVVGAGLGHPIVWTDVSGNRESRFTADTPLVLPAKLGVVGTAIAVLLGITYVGFLLTRWRHESSGAVLGAGLFVLASAMFIPLGMPIEDKSFSFGFALLLAMVVATYVRSDPSGGLPAPPVVPRS